MMLTQWWPGIRGIFVTQSNDFALGLPLLASMYPTELTRYIYIAAPISFLWINPMCFALLEMGTRTGGGGGGEGRRGGCRTAWIVFKGAHDTLKSQHTLSTYSFFPSFLPSFFFFRFLPFFLIYIYIACTVRPPHTNTTHPI